MSESPNHDQRIDEGVNALIDTLGIAGTIFPQLHLAQPMIAWLVKREGERLKTDIKSGAVVPDDRGGYVPKENSRYNPETGEFLTSETKPSYDPSTGEFISPELQRKAEEAARVDHGSL
jgi:hypothetical protein